jgi:predicted GNAT superfamily acetyltransferase
MSAITIRQITDVAGFHAAVNLQRDVWRGPDLEVVGVYQLRAAVSAGGVVLGAFDERGTLLGFCYGFIGLRDGKLLFYSHLAGVRPEYQDRDIGFSLKRAQRQAALDRGLDRIVWTYDPLQSLNASFNLRKLGATAARYFVDYYGEMSDAINRGLPSDRLEVDWWLRDSRVEARLSGNVSAPSWPDAPAALAGRMRDDMVTPDSPALNMDDRIVRIEIPTAFGQLKARSPEVALAWRMASRQTFLHYFGRDYRATDFVIRHADAIGSYVLQRGPSSAGSQIGRKETS